MHLEKRRLAPPHSKALRAKPKDVHFPSNAAICGTHPEPLRKHFARSALECAWRSHRFGRVDRVS
jgi:hypothetical protein